MRKPSAFSPAAGAGLDGLEAPVAERKAGDRLLAWAQTPMGEEVLEGLAGGLMAGLPLFVQDNDPGQAALMTATAIAGGIGVGIAGRKVGAHMGRKFHEAPLADQAGLAALTGRSLGQETIGDALAENGKMMRGQVADYLVENKATDMLEKGLINEQELTQLKELRKVGSVKDMVANAPEEMRSQLMQAALHDIDVATANAVALEAMGISPSQHARLRELENMLTQGSVDDMDSTLREIAVTARDIDDPGVREMKLPQLLEGIVSGDVKPVTGEHVGRAIGRLAGDEIGILGGLGLGALVSQQLDIQSPKDREIARLQDQLSGRA